MRFDRAFLALPLLTLLACGGQTAGNAAADSGAGADVDNPDGGPSSECPQPSVAPGQACTIPGLKCASVGGPAPNCGNVSTVMCTCEQGAWQCPIATGAPCVVPCPDPSTVVSGLACTAAPGLQCPSSVERDPCAPPGSAPVSCACQSDAWLCPSDLGGACAVDAGVVPILVSDAAAGG